MGKGNDPNCAAATPMTAALPDLSAMTVADIDQLWFDQAEPLRREQQQLNETRKTIRRYRKFGQSAPEYLTRQEQRSAERIAELQQQLAPFDEQWEQRGGWPRAYLVLNRDGHIHRSRTCKQLHVSTQIAWLPDLSGADDQQVIEHAGHMACTTCFPDAPRHPAFIASAREAEKDRSAKQQGRCDGSGQIGETINWRAASPTGRCPVCGQSVGVSSRGKLRPHKPA